MQIFEAEIIDGLSQLITAQASISYASLVEPSDKSCSINKNIKALAGLSDKDLYYTQSILVTTSWNKNDDIFDKAEVWNARNTPIHKPTNLEHNENAIVGHITANWPITDDGILIDSATPLENLPDKYHILTGSVIYTGYTEPELRERASTLISEIENGVKYVSMECFFSGFDYGLTNKSTGQFKVLGRNEETAFLTKYLRAYGGTGEHKEHKIGRVLRNITFSGKGFVNKPANPESIIFTANNFHFTEEEKKDTFANQGVFSIQANLKENDMSEVADKVDTEQKNEVVTSSVDCSEAVAEIKSAAANLETQKTELEGMLQATQLELSEIKASVENKDSTLTNLASELEQLKSQLESANETIAAYKSKEAEMMKKEKNMKRQAALVEAGMNSELAVSTVEKFSDLTDEDFESMKEVFAAVMPPKKKSEDTEETEMKKTSKSAEDSVEQILEQAEPESTLDLSVGSDTTVSEVENTRAALVDFVYNRLGKKLNKGE